MNSSARSTDAFGLLPESCEAGSQAVGSGRLIAQHAALGGPGIAPRGQRLARLAGEGQKSGTQTVLLKSAHLKKPVELDFKHEHC